MTNTNTKTASKHPRPKFQLREHVLLDECQRMIPATVDAPAVLRDTVLRVSHISGKGTKSAPWFVVVTDGAGHFWSFEPGQIRRAADVQVDDGIYEAVRRQVA